MTTITVTVEEIDNEVWLTAKHENFPYTASGDSYLTAATNLKKIIAKKHGLDTEDIKLVTLKGKE